MDNSKSTFEYKAKYDKLLNKGNTAFQYVPGQDSKTLGFLLVRLTAMIITLSMFTTLLIAIIIHNAMESTNFLLVF